MFPIAELSKVDVVFPTNVQKIMPKWADLPDEFKRGHTKWNELFSDMFFCGVKNLNLTAKEGVDRAKALAHIRAISGSFEPSHEHKEAAVAYLFSQWFEDGATWDRAK